MCGFVTFQPGLGWWHCTCGLIVVCVSCHIVHSDRVAKVYYCLFNRINGAVQVSSWGGYVFLINLIPLHVLALMVTGRFSHRVYVAYSAVSLCIGTVGLISSLLLFWFLTFSQSVSSGSVKNFLIHFHEIFGSRRPGDKRQSFVDFVVIWMLELFHYFHHICLQHCCTLL